MQSMNIMDVDFQELELTCLQLQELRGTIMVLRLAAEVDGLWCALFRHAEAQPDHRDTEFAGQPTLRSTKPNVQPPHASTVLPCSCTLAASHSFFHCWEERSPVRQGCNSEALQGSHACTKAQKKDSTRALRAPGSTAKHATYKAEENARQHLSHRHQ